MLEGMAERPEIDPRYDPAFQRGFDASRTGAPDAAVAAAPRVTSALQRPVAAAAAPAQVTSAERAERAERHASADAGATLATGAGDAAPHPGSATAASGAHAPQPALRPPWTNPFAIVVAIVGIAVLATGVWMLQETHRLVESGEAFQTQVDFWFQQWAMVAGPVFTGLGVAILVAVLMLCAVYWGRRPAHGDEG